MQSENIFPFSNFSLRVRDPCVGLRLGYIVRKNSKDP